MSLISLLHGWSGGSNLSAPWLVRWFSESARWLVLNRRSDEALKTLHRVARINGKSEMMDKLTIEVTCLFLCLTTFGSVTYIKMGDNQSEAEISPMWPAGFTLSHEKGDWVESVVIDSVRPSEDQRDETHLHLSDRCLVRKHTCVTFSLPVFIHLYSVTVIYEFSNNKQQQYPNHNTSQSLWEHDTEALHTCLPVHLSTCIPGYLYSSPPVYLSSSPPVYLPTCPSAAVCLPLQVLHQFCILRFGDGSAEVRGESPD